MGDGLGLQPNADPVGALNNVCADNETVHGIDVSYYQGSIDWNAVAGDAEFALIRVSHSTQFLDPDFETNWNDAHAAGVPVGAYQYFEPDEDPIAQANLLLDNMGPLMAGDLPPVIDVESAAGQSPAQIEAAILAWVEHVEAETGVKSIIYTGPYFWQDNVNSDAFGDYPLWIAHYGTECPLTPTPWVRWDMHQYSSTGSTAGIVGDVDQNTFNGSLDDLIGLGGEAPPCGVIGPDGATIDNGASCYQLHGSADYWRDEAAGVGGSLVWTNATEFDDPSNYAVWRLWFDEAGEYEVEAHIEPQYAQSEQAVYAVSHAAGSDDVLVDQSASDGWVSLGTYDFDAATDHQVRLDDNTGEANADEIQIVFDALRVTRIDGGGGESGAVDESGGEPPGDDDAGGASSDGEGTPPSGDSDSEGDGTGGLDSGPALPGAGNGGADDGCSCRSNGGSPPAFALLGLLGLLRSRRRRS